MRFVVVFDLDNTLLHSLPETHWGNLMPWQLTALKLHKISCRHADGTDEVLCVKIRPGALKRLYSILNKGIPVYIFSAGGELYVRTVMRLIDPGGLIPTDRIFNRTHMKDKAHKQISLIAQHANIDCQDILIVDDRRDVWRECGAEMNVLQVPPYIYADPHNDESTEVLDGVFQCCLDFQKQESCVFTPTVALYVDFGYCTMRFDFVFLVDPKEVPEKDSWLDGKRHGFQYVTKWCRQVTHVLAWSASSTQVRQAYRIPYTKRPTLVTPDWLWKSIMARRKLDERDFPVRSAAQSTRTCAETSNQQVMHTKNDAQTGKGAFKTPVRELLAKRSVQEAFAGTDAADINSSDSSCSDIPVVDRQATKRQRV